MNDPIGRPGSGPAPQDAARLYHEAGLLDVDEAIELLRPYVANDLLARRLAAPALAGDRAGRAWEILRPRMGREPTVDRAGALLLERLGRVDEAAVVLARLVGVDDHPEGHLTELAELLAPAGRLDEALAAGAARAERTPRWAPELFLARTAALARHGRLGQAVIEIRRHPLADKDYMRWHLDELMCAADWPPGEE